MVSVLGTIGGMKNLFTKIWASLARLYRRVTPELTEDEQEELKTW